MNIRIEEQSLRFKISEEELQVLLNGQAVQTKTILLDKALIVTISPDKDSVGMEPKLLLDKHEASLNLCVLPEKLQELSDISPSKNGLQQETSGLSISLQVDMPEACHS